MCAEQLVPIRQIAAAMAGCVSFGADCCKRGERAERALVADLAERRRRIVLQRTVELGDLGQPRNRRGDLVVADRFDHGAAEEIDAARRVANQHLGDLGILRHRGERANQRRADELAFFLVERGQHPRRERRAWDSARNRRRRLRAGDRSATTIAVSIASAVRGSLKPVSSVSALKRMKPSACSLTACSNAGTACAAGARRIVRPAAMRVG